MDDTAVTVGKATGRAARNAGWLASARQPSGLLLEGYSTIVGAENCRARWGGAAPVLWTVFLVGVGILHGSNLPHETCQGPR